MVTISEYFVVEPPTSAEVQERALEALKTGGLLKLTILGQHEVPSPTALPIKFRIAQTTHPDEGGMRISGMRDDETSVVVSILKDLSAPATASVVSA